MKLWVKYQDGLIVEGPIGEDVQPEGFIEFEEILELEPDHGECQVTVELVDGRCIKRVVGKANYRLQRRREYPSVGDQLDCLWHAMDLNQLPRIEPFYSDIKTVKDRFPKPEQA